MSTAVPPGSGPSGPAQGDTSSPSTPLSWEGDRMFNIYIYDYCYKRGFRKTARELLAEADISPESTPPINARQGLLFEWWSVFWVLFTAKSNGNGSEDAMLYTQHQAQRQAQQRMNPQAQMGRFVGGMPRPGLMSNGSMPNGVGSAALPGQVPMPTGGQGPVSFSMSGPGSQPNGIPGALPNPGGSSGGFGPLLPGQRQPPLGSQQRGPPFQSPTMAHSPQNPGGAPLQQHPQAPMGQLGPSPHLAPMNRGGMLPPNGLQGMNNQGPMGAVPSHTPTPGFQQLGRPPSRAATPGQNTMITHPSPSLVARQPPGGMASDLRAQENAINIELNRIPPPVLNALKQEAGLGDKDMMSLTIEEKQRIMTVARLRNGSRNVKAGPSGANNAAAGPSGSNPSMQPPNQRNQQQQQQQQHHQQQQRGNKRNSTSPGEEHETLPRNDASPPDRKRVRRSPMGMDQQQQPLTSMSYPHPPPQGPGGPQQMSNNMIRGPMGGPPMNGFPHQPGLTGMGANPGMSMPMGQGMGVPQMGNAMSPGMNHPGSGGMMTPQMQMQQHLHAREAQYRHSMHSMHKGGLAPGGVLNSALPGAGSPSASDPSFNPGGPQGQGPQFSAGPNNRMGQGKPMGMMPPPSPALNGPPKDQPGSNKDNKGANSNSSNSHPEGSPRNAPNSGQGQGPSNPGNPGQGGTAPATPVPGPNQNMTAPSPSAILGNPNQSAQAPSAPDLFSSDFIQSVASSLDEFDPSIFRSDGDINFERDFGQWFNPDDVGSLDLK